MPEPSLSISPLCFFRFANTLCSERPLSVLFFLLTHYASLTTVPFPSFQPGGPPVYPKRSSLSFLLIHYASNVTLPPPSVSCFYTMPYTLDLAVYAAVTPNGLGAACFSLRTLNHPFPNLTGCHCISPSLPNLTGCHCTSPSLPNPSGYYRTSPSLPNPSGYYRTSPSLPNPSGQPLSSLIDTFYSERRLST